MTQITYTSSPINFRGDATTSELTLWLTELTHALEAKELELADSARQHEADVQERDDQVAALQELVQAKDEVLAQCIKRFQVNDARQAELTRRIRAKESEIRAKESELATLGLRLNDLDKLVRVKDEKYALLEALLHAKEEARNQVWYRRMTRTWFRNRRKS